jgi:hypothetical protein
MKLKRLGIIPGTQYLFRRCALALCAIGLRSGVGSKERMGAINERAPLFSPPPIAPPGFGFACATQRLIIASFRGLLCEEHPNPESG